MRMKKKIIPVLIAIVLIRIVGASLILPKIWENIPIQKKERI